MIKIIYKFAMMAALVVFAFRMLNGSSIWFSLLRASMVFMGTLFTFYIAGHILKVGLYLTETKQQVEEEVEKEV